jgi:hypothetical protein
VLLPVVPVRYPKAADGAGTAVFAAALVGFLIGYL